MYVVHCDDVELWADGDTVAPKYWRRPPDEPAPVIGGNERRRNRTPPPIEALPLVYDTYAMMETLKEAGYRDVDPIASASTPINKFVYENLKCDLNVNDLGGWYNSSLLLHYCNLSPYVLRPMVYALKLWATSHRLNDPSGATGPATMSSYCLTLMAIAYLQHTRNLPNLQADIVAPDSCIPQDTSEHDIAWVSWGKDQGVKAHIGFALTPPAGWAPADPELTVADAVRGFFAFFAQGVSLNGHRFDQSTCMVSILQGGIVPRAKEYGQEARESQTRRSTLLSLGIPLETIRRSEELIKQERFSEEMRMGKGDRGIQPRNWGEKRLVVQDPFLWLKNCAGSMSREGIIRWWAAVDNTDRKLNLHGKNMTMEDLLMM